MRRIALIAILCSTGAGAQERQVAPVDHIPDPSISANGPVSSTITYSDGFSDIRVETPQATVTTGGIGFPGEAKERDADYWREQYRHQPYYNNSSDYALYEPAYRFGEQLYRDKGGVAYESLDPQALRREWENKANSDLSWDEAEAAVRDAYLRLAGNLPPQRASGSGVNLGPIEGVR